MKILLLSMIALAVVACSPVQEEEGEWISLFDGKSFEGWQPNNNPESWVFEDGAFKTVGEVSHLFYVGDVANHDFKNFEFYAEVKTMPGANSGIYVHTKFTEDDWPPAGYECQVVNSNQEGNYIEHKMTGSIYAVRNTWKTSVGDNEWFKYRILVSGKTIRTFINDELICEYTEAESPWRADDKQLRRIGSGTIAFQAHDPGSVVYYRGMKVRLLPDDAPSLSTPEADAELDRLISKFSNDNVPLIDVGIVETSKGSLDAVSREYGLSLGDDYAKSSIPSDGSVAVITASEPVAIVASLQAAKAAGKKVIFDSGGVESVDVAALKTRLKAMEASGLGWSDYFVPEKTIIAK